MKQALLPFLRCPVSQAPLAIQVISQKGEEIEEGWLESPLGCLYPIVRGVPRMLVESFEDFASFLQLHVPDFDEKRRALWTNYGPLIAQCQNRNAGTKASFSFEWSLLDYDQDKLWHEDLAQVKQTLLQETGMQEGDFAGKICLDAGCGHGLIANLMSEMQVAQCMAFDVGQSVERAAARFARPNLHFIQADVWFPPFQLRSFQLVHSSGVIHHTPVTEVAFSALHELVAPGGRFSVWLYHPISSWKHRLLTRLRPYTSRLPVRFQYALYRIFIFPPVFFIQKLKGKRVNSRELMIDLMDALSCPYRWEHSEAEARAWYAKRGYGPIQISSRNFYGFSVFGIKY